MRVPSERMQRAFQAALGAPGRLEIMLCRPKQELLLKPCRVRNKQKSDWIPTEGRAPLRGIQIQRIEDSEYWHVMVLIVCFLIFFFFFKERKIVLVARVTFGGKARGRRHLPNNLLKQESGSIGYGRPINGRGETKPLLQRSGIKLWTY